MFRFFLLYFPYYKKKSYNKNFTLYSSKVLCNLFEKSNVITYLTSTLLFIPLVLKIRDYKMDLFFIKTLQVKNPQECL